ncbi:glycosyltransferase [Ruminococcus flavefaciens]|uniref:glycosyltransferase n=1 Tax=Ruminococcus flavefaciens TaxID=1265 RepID=UPI000463C6CE|nr:glycosyltransferase [Ruminococcus flavefaciens]
MNIIWITLESLLPANTGGRLGVYKRLEQIAKTENVFLFYPYDDQEELKNAKELRKLCKEVHPYYRGANRLTALKKIWRYPFTVGSRMISEMQKDINACLEKNAIDVINVDFPHMCANLFNINVPCPIVLNEHNIEWKVYKSISHSQKNPLKKVAYFIDSYRLKRYERNLFQKIRFSKITFVSSDDMEYMIRKNMCTNEQAELIPVGADINRIDAIKKHITKNIIFVGKMSYGPNIEAVTWFNEEIFPKILKNEPSCKFYIVGKEPTDEVKALAGDSIIVTGTVDSVEKYYDLADLVVLPLKNGGGVKVKLLEAIGHDLPIVSTSVGVQGTIYKDKKSVPVHDDALEFADACVKSINGNYKERFKKMFAIFEENYTWEQIGERYLELFNEVI